MTDPFADTPGLRPPLPLQGLTILAVEDSRFASDALRLMCQRSGARLRRADSLMTARAHLRVYRPDAVLVDLGLPDGRGEDLIRTLALQPGPRPPILGMSGDAAGRKAALAAGAQGFLEKPVGSLAAFQRLLLDHLPERFLHAPAEDGVVIPDPLAMADDLARAARMLAAGPDARGRQYLVGFLRGLARIAGDDVLARAVEDSATGPGLRRLAGLIDMRIAAAPAFRSTP